MSKTNIESEGIFFIAGKKQIWCVVHGDEDSLNKSGWLLFQV